MKKYFCFLILMFCIFFLGAQNQNADIVILLDNSGTMLPYYDQINTQVLTEVSSKFIRLGDTVHLISFSDKITPEISQQINTENDVKKLVSRFNLIYPFGPYTDFLSAVNYSKKFISGMKERSEKFLIVISDGLYYPAPSSPNYSTSPNVVEEMIKSTLVDLETSGVNVYYIKAPFPEGVLISDLQGNIVSSAKTNVAQTHSSSSTIAGTTGDVASSSKTTKSYADKSASTDVTKTTVGSSTNAGLEKESGTSKKTDDLSKVSSGPISMDELGLVASTPDPFAQSSGSQGNAKPDYYEYSSTLQKADTVTTAEITPESPETGVFVSNLPLLTGEKNLGKKRYNFTYPITIENVSEETIILDLKNVFIDGSNILAKETSINVPPKSQSNINVALAIPETMPEGEQIFTAFFMFDKDIRTQPQQLTFSVELSKTGAFIKFLKNNWLWLLLIILALLAILLVIYLLKSSPQGSRGYSKRTTSKDSMPTLDNANVSNGSMPTLDRTSASNGSMPTLERTNASNGSMPTLGSINSKTSSSMSTLSNTKTSSSGSMPTLGSINSRTSSSMSTLSNTKASSSGSMPGLMSKAQAYSKKATIPPASSSEPIKAIKDGTITLDFVVDGQTRNIGFRNIHAMTAGSRKTVGGGFSSFSIFLVQVPSAIAEIRFDGQTCTLALLKPEFFPYETNNIIPNCLGKIFTVRAETGYEMTIHFEPYVSQTEKLNELLLSLVPEENKKKYL